MSLRGVLLSQHGNQKHFVQLEPFELFLSFIQVLFLLQLLLLYCSVEVGFQFLICRSKHSSVGDCPVTI